MIKILTSNFIILLTRKQANCYHNDVSVYKGGYRMKRKMFMLSIMMTLLLTSTMASTKVLAENEVDVNAMVDNMTIREVIGQKIIMSFRSWEGSNWTEYQEGVQEVIDNYHLGGAILFAMNTVETAQMTRLIHRHGKATIDNGGIPLFFSVD